VVPQEVLPQIRGRKYQELVIPSLANGLLGKIVIQIRMALQQELPIQNQHLIKIGLPPVVLAQEEVLLQRT
jgi:hypothetical protein